MPNRNSAANQRRGTKPIRSQFMIHAPKLVFGRWRAGKCALVSARSGVTGRRGRVSRGFAQDGRSFSLLAWPDPRKLCRSKRRWHLAAALRRRCLAQSMHEATNWIVVESTT